MRSPRSWARVRTTFGTITSVALTSCGNRSFMAAMDDDSYDGAFCGCGNQMSMSSGAHDEFLELCALAASGELSPPEQEKLCAHLAGCSSCREAQEQFASLVAGPISALAAEEPADSRLAQDSSWSIESAEAALFEHLAEEQSDGRNEVLPGRKAQKTKTLGRPMLTSMEATWRELWFSYAAAVLLIVSFGVAAYRVGISHRVLPSMPSAVAVVEPTGKDKNLEEQISDLSHERELARHDISRRDKMIADLKLQLQQQSAELARLKVSGNELQQEATVRKSGQDASQQQTELEKKLQQAESEAQSLRAQIGTLEKESSQAGGRATLLQAKVDDLTRALEEKEAEVGQQQDLLAHDRDIRELMGARDLYIAEVYDVARSGETQQAFGRLFYTKKKSLIFYAYDLDHEPGIKNASAFQAWGRRGPDWSKALNLGIFYQDNAAKKRWVLKFTDPKSLAQIDAVFVTIEPEGGSRKPSGQPLLFAYLKMDANHP